MGPGDDTTTTPVMTIYVRHSANSKHKKKEFWKGCDCRKPLRWVQDGIRYRGKANTCVGLRRSIRHVTGFL